MSRGKWLADYFESGKPKSMIVVVDNYDSVPFNLVQMLGAINPVLDIRVFRNDRYSVDQVEYPVPVI